MSKKIFTSWLIAVFALMPFFSVSFVSAKDSTEVCGVNNKTYASAIDAENAGVEVSYNFACTVVTNKNNLYEKKNNINFAGALLEIGSTDVPTTLVIRNNKNGNDFTVEISENTVLAKNTELSNWIPGDQIRVIGEINENTGVVESTRVDNLSIIHNKNIGANGWITKVATSTKEITYQWNNTEHTFLYDDDTKFVVGLKNPASAEDLVEGDRIRARLIREDGKSLAKILIVLRRSNDLFMKVRTVRPNATLVRLDSTIIPTTIQVRINKTPGLKKGDINNLAGTDGDLVTLNITEKTKLVRKYFGKILLDEFSIGDQLSIVGRANNDQTIDAKMIKNNSIWKTSTQGHAGVVKEINTKDNYLMINWTPVNYLTSKKLKEKLNGTRETFMAQIMDTKIKPILFQDNKMSFLKKDTNKIKIKATNIAAKLKNRIKHINDKKIGQYKRIVQNKKINIKRIQNKNIKISDLIKRKPTKKIRVDLNDNTIIIVGTNKNASINDITIGDKVRIRGVRNSESNIVVAENIVVVSSLPEIEADSDEFIDDINTIVNEIVTDSTDDAIVDDTSTDNEEVIEDEDNSTIEDDDDNNNTEKEDNDSDNDNDNIEDNDDDSTVENDTVATTDEMVDNTSTTTISN